MMPIKLIFLFICQIGFFHSGFSQKRLTVIYEETGRNLSQPYPKSQLAINDSVSYYIRVEQDGKEIKLKEPLGSQFLLHSTYTDRKGGFHLSQSQPYNNPKYLIRDTLLKTNWISALGTKTILGYKCEKAVAQLNGSTYIAWYAPDLPLAFGPYNFGGLEGLILELQNISTHWAITGVSISFSSPYIIEPQKGKLITMAEFRKKIAAIPKIVIRRY